VTRARTEEGFTLIELVMAVTVLALAIFGLAAVFGASIRTGAVDVHRTNGVALATQWTERLRAVPYERLGLADGDTSPACDSGASVVVVDQPGVTAADVLPTTVGGIAFTVGRCVTWMTDSNSVATEAYKRTTVVVSWTDEAGPHQVRQDAAAYPGGLGPAASTSTTAAASCAGPPSPAAAVGVVLPTPVTAQLDWSTPAGSPSPIGAWLVEYSADGWTTSNVVTDGLSAAPPGQSNRATVGGLGSQTAYTFRVVALPVTACAVSDSDPADVSVTTGAETGVPSCAVGLATASPPVVARDPGSADLGPLALTVAVASNGNCSALTVTYQATAATGPETATLGQVSGDHWQAQLPAIGAPEAWDLGLHTLTITDGGVPVAEVTACVVNSGATAC
jgi:hypothetical protein